MTTKVKGLYALVVYQKLEKKRATESAPGSQVSGTFYDVLELSLIPKNHRVEGDTARVTWEDSVTKQKSCHYVTIKKISDDRDQLLRMYTVDASTGEIAGKETRIFTEQVHQNKKEKQLIKKTEKIARHTAQSKIDTTISKDTDLWTSVESTQSVIPHSERKQVRTVCTASHVALVSKPPSPVSLKESLSAEAAPLDNVSPVDLLCHSPVCPSAIAKDSEEVEGRYAKFWATMKDLAAVATPENIAFLASVVESLKLSSSSPSNKISSCNDQKPVYEIPHYYKISGKGKVPIFEGIDFYFFEGVKNAIERKSYTTNKITLKQEKSWQLLVRYCLTEVYGSHLGECSAKGAKEGRRPAIDHDLYKALLYWSRQWYGDHVEEIDFISFINKTAYNKRKAKKQKDNGKTLSQSPKQQNIEEPKVSGHQVPKPSGDNKKQKQKKNQLKDSEQLANQELSEQLNKQQLPEQLNTQLSTTTIKQCSESVPEQQQLEVIKNQHHSQQSVTKHHEPIANQNLVCSTPTLEEPSKEASLPIGTDSVLPSLGLAHYGQYPPYYQNSWNQHYDTPPQYQYPRFPNMPYSVQNGAGLDNGPNAVNVQTRLIYENCDNAGNSQISSNPLTRFHTDMEYQYL